MAVTLTINGTSYSFPQTGDQNWGDSVTNWATAVTNGMLQKAGGNFTLTSDANFGGSFGLLSKYFTSQAALNPSTSGVLRLGSADAISWRNNANSGNLPLTTDASDNLLWNGHIISSSAGVTPVADGGTGFGSYTIGDTLYASGATAFSKLGIGASNTVNVSTGSAPSWALLANANISSSAAIAYSKLNLTGAVLNADLAGSIAYSKLSLTGSILNADLAGSIAASKLVGSDITTLGTITTGTWSATAITAPKGGTGQSSFTTGDLLYASSSSAISKLAIGSAGQFLKVSGGLPSWGSSASLAVAAKTTTYSILNTDDALTADTSGAGFTMTLPDCASNSGKVFRIKKITSDFNVLTISRAGSDTIQDAAQASTTTINTLGEEIDIVSFGSTIWQVLNRRVPSIETSFTPTGSFVTNTTYTGSWKRDGSSIRIYAHLAFSGAPDNVTLTINIPFSLTINNVANFVANGSPLGSVAALIQSNNFYEPVIYNNSTSVIPLTLQSNSGSNPQYINTNNGFSRTNLGTIGSGDTISFLFEVPITGWNG